MKRFIVICMLLVFMLNGLVACGKKESADNADIQDPENTQVVEETETPEPTQEAKPEDTTSNTAPSSPVTTPNNESTNGNTSTSTGEETLGSKLVAEFKSIMPGATSIENVANALAQKADMDCVVTKVQEGYLNGFSDEVKGFSDGYCFSPMIGSIPFVGYVFESSDAEALKTTLLNLADPRWNICTEAEETVVAVVGNYVFFAMCPGADY